MDYGLKIARLQGELIAQRAAYVALAHHLARQDLARLQVLAGDLRTLAGTRSEPGWQDALGDLAHTLDVLDNASSTHR